MITFRVLWALMGLSHFTFAFDCPLEKYHNESRCAQILQHLHEPYLSWDGKLLWDMNMSECRGKYQPPFEMTFKPEKFRIISIKESEEVSSYTSIFIK